MGNKISAFLSHGQYGWGRGVIADSGNGYHLEWATKPLDPQTGKLLYGQILAVLRHKFESPDVNMTIDMTMLNETRVITVWGTYNRKYPHREERPQRQTKILSSPKKLRPLSESQLELVVLENPIATEEPTKRNTGTGREEHGSAEPAHLTEFLDAHDLTYREIKADGWEAMYDIECLWEEEHGPSNRDDTIVGVRDGLFCHACKHSHCEGRDWRAFRDKLDPEHTYQFPVPDDEEELVGVFCAEDGADEPAETETTKEGDEFEFAALPETNTKSDGHDESQPKRKTYEFRFHTEKTPKFNATIVGIRMSDIRTEKLEWLWPDKIPAGNITLFGGQPGCGKSIVLLDIVSRTTTGKDWADGSKNTAGPRDVLLLASEDGEADTIKPRLIAAGADMSRIIVIRRVLMEPPDGDKGKGKSKHAFQLDGDILTLKNALKANSGVALVALDPISAFFGNSDPNKDKEIRPVMEAIADAMEGTKCAFIGIIHNNKRGDADSISKILGASSVVGVARAVWGFGYDADDKTLRHMLLVKGNLSEKRTGMSYKLVNTAIKLDYGEEDGQPVCDWQGETDEDADDMLAKKREKAKNGSPELKSDAAQMMLKRELANGWKLLRDLHRIREREGISESTMKRARYTLGVICTKSAPWMWAMPGTPAPESKEHWVEDAQVSDQEVM